MSGCRVAVRGCVGALEIDVAFALTKPWTVLFGPSGSGKSSILRAMSGLLPPSVETMFDLWQHNDLAALASRPSHERSLAYAPQTSSLFPHLSVRRNVSFGYEMSAERNVKTTLIDRAIELFHLRTIEDRMPRELSGGEAQRVSLARAFAVPTSYVMLLDEPFTGLDRRMRNELAPRMRAWCRDRNLWVLSVTHDVEEAMLLDAEVIRVEAGKAMAQGPAREILAEERIRMLKALR